MAHKAFVSSTYEDLKEHRTYVIAALRKAGIAVDPMEDWTASASEPKEFSQARLQGCDLCVLLVGLRRGHVPQGEELSITQLEYRAAQQLVIDTLVFMLDEDAPWPRKFDELDRDPKTREFRAALLEQKGVSRFGLSPDSIQIAPALSRWLSEGSATAKASLVIQSVDFKYAQQNRRNRLLLFNGHSIPVFAQNMWLEHKEMSLYSPTFTLDTIVPANTIIEIVSPPFQNNESGGESWNFPSDESGHVQSLDTNWAQREPGWEHETWPNGHPKFVTAVISYRAGEDRRLASAIVWQGFSLALGRRWR